MSQLHIESPQEVVPNCLSKLALPEHDPDFPLPFYTLYTTKRQSLYAIHDINPPMDDLQGNNSHLLGDLSLPEQGEQRTHEKGDPLRR